MIWIEAVCDGCYYSAWGEPYKKGSAQRIKAVAKSTGWKVIKGKLYCPDCQLGLETDKENENV